MRFFLVFTTGLLFMTYAFAQTSKPNIDQLRKSIDDNQRNIESLDKKIEALEKSIQVTVTAYSPTVEECDDDPYITAYNKPVKIGSLAVSRDLEKELGWKFGDKVHLHGLGTFEVWDRMSSKWSRRVDIFFFNTDEARAFGIRKTMAKKILLPGKWT